MKKLLLLPILFSISTFAQTLAVVNGEEISTKSVNSFLKSMNQEANYDSLDQSEKNLILHQTIEKALLIQEAKKDKLDKNKDYLETLKNLESGLLVEFFMKNELEKIQIDKKDVESYYNSHLYEFKQDKKLKARHIVVEDLKVAKDIIKKLNSAKNKEDEFINLASEYSLDGAASNGGELGWFEKKDVVDDFWVASNSLKINEYSKEPVQSMFGYHIIFLNEIQEPLTIKLDQVYSNIETTLKMEKFQSIIDDRIKNIKQNAKIEIK